jgi:hypothetical protein
LLLLSSSSPLTASAAAESAASSSASQFVSRLAVAYEVISALAALVAEQFVVIGIATLHQPAGVLCSCKTRCGSFSMGESASGCVC